MLTDNRMSSSKSSKIFAGEQEMTAPGKNTKSFRSLALSSGMPDRIFGFQKKKDAYRRIRRNGLRSFINSTIIYRIRLHAFRLQILILYRVNLYGSYNKRCPDKSRFLQLMPVSPSGCQGKPSVCLVSSNMSAGGAQRQVSGVACALKNIGYDV